MLRFIAGFIYIVFSFSVIQIILTLFLLILKKSILTKFQNDHIFQHNGFNNADKKYLDTFWKMGLLKGIMAFIQIGNRLRLIAGRVVH